MLRHDISGKKLVLIWAVGSTLMTVPLLFLTLQTNDEYCNKVYHENPYGEDWTEEEYHECLEADDTFYQTFRNVHPESFTVLGVSVMVMWVRFCFKFYREELRAET